ncbi:TetR/AcrR family transcriptional regulator [Ornithinibacillus halophilus]|uniref:Transcriptional regulator, TetR family n=1 Tax=Ornithinibacillus halophilus TaxID=930117 RepID=A0A1M5N3E2_9BACI|nr:TetR/AcrR family transcriptional regulator [Ornithinibacillus halophilus]SHG83955.1 transcriptional regulator, TetR family [Ornithinibacillus halophilus]
MKQDLRVIKTQESLRHALLILIKEKPLDSITVAELCRLANINRGTFYLHYKDVHGVFKHYLEVIVKDLRKSYEEPYYKTNFKIENIKPDMIKIFHHVKNYQEFYQIIFDQHIPMMYYYLLFDTVRSFMKETIDRMNQERMKNVQVDYLVSYQTNAILGILIEWHQNEYSTSIDELNQQLILILSINSPFRKGIQ